MNRSLPNREWGKDHPGPRELWMQRCGNVFWDSLDLGMYIVEIRTSGWGHMKMDFVVWGQEPSNQARDRENNGVRLLGHIQ